jgi:hypothetical protein
LARSVRFFFFAYSRIFLILSKNYEESVSVAQTFSLFAKKSEKKQRRIGKKHKQALIFR